MYIGLLSIWEFIHKRSERQKPSPLWENSLATDSWEDRISDYLSDQTQISSSPLRKLGSDPELDEKLSRESHKLEHCVFVYVCVCLCVQRMCQ